jgi:hypothetical protein
MVRASRTRVNHAQVHRLARRRAALDVKSRREPLGGDLPDFDFIDAHTSSRFIVPRPLIVTSSCIAWAHQLPATKDSEMEIECTCSIIAANR